MKGYATGEEGHKVGDRVYHYRDDLLVGTIMLVEENRLSCMVLWDEVAEDNIWDFQWSNKLIKIT